MSMQPNRSHRAGARAVRRALAPLAMGLLLAAAAPAQAPEPQPPQPEGYDAAEPAEPGMQPADAGNPAYPGNPAYQATEADEAQPQPVAGSYGYLRLVEGSATVVPASSGNTSAAEINQPIMVGDRISVPPRGRVEAVLADHNIVRLDGDTQVVFTRLANSADRQDPSTELRLETGNLQLIVTQDSVGQELPTVLTPNASVYVQAYGSYRVTSDRGDFTEVVVRRGTAEVVSDSGDNPVHAGEEAIVDNQRGSGAAVRQAGAYDALERWARQVDGETRVAQSSYVDPSLSYDAAPLDRYGHWINADGRNYWQPNEEDSGWSPYWQGHWDYTPQRPVLGVLRALGLGALPLWHLGLPADLRMGLAARVCLRTGLGVLVLGAELRRLVPGRLLHRLLRRLLLRLPLRSPRLGGRRVGRLPPLELRRHRPFLRARLASLGLRRRQGVLPARPAGTRPDHHRRAAHHPGLAPPRSGRRHARAGRPWRRQPA